MTGGGKCEWFVVAQTFAAPFFSETVERYVEAHSAREALEDIAPSYYYAGAWASADDYHHGRAAVAEWKSNKLLALERGKSSYGVYSSREGALEVDGEAIEVEDPRGGRVVA